MVCFPSMAALSLDVAEVVLVTLSPMNEEHGGNRALMMLVLEFEMTGFKGTVHIVHALIDMEASSSRKPVMLLPFLLLLRARSGPGRFLPFLSDPTNFF